MSAEQHFQNFGDELLQSNQGKLLCKIINQVKHLPLVILIVWIKLCLYRRISKQSMSFHMESIGFHLSKSAKK